MRRKYSKNDILKFIYGEMSPRDHDEFLDALCTDEELFETFEAIQQAQEQLSPVELSPSEQSVKRIMHFAGVNARRKPRRDTVRIGKGKTFSTPHLVSIFMVFFTCITVGVVMFIYKRDTIQENNWSISKDVMKFENQALDQRLDFARERLGDIIDNRHSAPMRLHHDTYRLVNTDLSVEEQGQVVLLNIK